MAAPNVESATHRRAPSEKEAHVMQKNRISIAIAIAAVSVSATAFAANAPAPGFYIGTQHLNPSKIPKTVDNFGSAAIRFIAPPEVNVPVRVKVKCGNFTYSYTNFPTPSRAQIWRQANGKAMSEKIMRNCQRGKMTVSFSPVIKK
jgi:hypothetical protein